MSLFVWRRAGRYLVCLEGAVRCPVCLEGVSDEMSPFVWREAGRYPVCLEGGGEMSCLSGGGER